MEEDREVFGESAHDLRGPHQDRPTTFVPLRLRLLPGRVPVAICRPAAVLGRHTDADVRLAFPEVSRHHCRVAFEHGQWRVYDLNSLNGLYINDERMAEAVLYEGDRLQLGGLTLLVESATPVRVLAPAEPGQDVLRQIADSLPNV